MIQVKYSYHYPNFHKVNHVDKYNNVYRISIVLSIFLIGLTNVILIESLTTFPVGWIASGFVVLLAGNCCCCLNEFFPRIFSKPRYKENVYQILYDSSYLPILTFAWAIFSTIICNELCISICLCLIFFSLLNKKRFFLKV